MKLESKKKHELAHMHTSELLSVALLAGVFTIALTFNDFYTSTQTNLVLVRALIVFTGMLIAVFMHEAAHKVVAARFGYETLIKAKPSSIVISLAVSVLSFGLIPFVIPNSIQTDARPDLRLTNLNKYFNAGLNAKIVLGGVAGTTLAIVVFNTLFLITGWAVIQTIVLGAVLHGVYSLIPWELASLLQLRFRITDIQEDPGDGVHLFYGTRLLHIFALVFMVVFGSLALIANNIAYLLSTVVALGAVASYKYWLGTKQ